MMRVVYWLGIHRREVELPRDEGERLCIRLTEQGVTWEAEPLHKEMGR